MSAVRLQRFQFERDLITVERNVRRDTQGAPDFLIVFPCNDQPANDLPRLAKHVLDIAHIPLNLPQHHIAGASAL